MALRQYVNWNFKEYFMVSFRLLFGDFEEEYVHWEERVLFVISIFLLPLILLNLYISVVGDIFDEVMNNR